MEFALEFSPDALRELKKLDNSRARRIIEKLKEAAGLLHSLRGLSGGRSTN